MPARCCVRPLRFQDVAELAEFSDTVADDELELLAERLKLRCALISSAVDSVWRAISPDLFRALKQMRVRPAAVAARAFLPSRDAWVVYRDEPASSLHG